MRYCHLVMRSFRSMVGPSRVKVPSPRWWNSRGWGCEGSVHALTGATVAAVSAVGTGFDESVNLAQGVGFKVPPLLLLAGEVGHGGG